MLKKIIAIKNVGRFRNSAAPANPQLAKHTLISGANAYGKSTICAILRSLQSGDASHVIGRRTLGSADAPSVELLLDSGTSRFDGTAWNVTKPSMAIFDGVFVAENVHSGDVVEIEHKRNLYRVIIGDEGVRLAAHDAELANASRTKTTEIGTASKAIQPHLPPGMKLEAFLGLPPTADIEVQIIEQQRSVEAVRQAGAIRDRALLASFTLPVVSDGLVPLLSRTLDDLAQDAERLVGDHIAGHAMTAGGGNWISTGLEHAEETCPFCGQNIQGLPLIAAFRAIFSVQYKTLVADIATTKASIAQAFGDATLARLDAIAAQNRADVEFWSKYCAFDAPPLALPPEFASSARNLGAAILALLDRKAAAPLEPLALDGAFVAVRAAYDAASLSVEAANAAIRTVNQLIADRKAATGAADVRSAESELARRRAVKVRHSEAVATLCDSYRALNAEKERIDKLKEEVRRKLDSHTKNVVKPYERRINEHLNNFNADFQITETKHAFPGGVATSSYQLVIKGTAIDVGDGKTPVDRPSFKNTLSAGDRTTLALAFFLAHLERDPSVAGKTVVFDDPFNSQDAFRRRQTVHEIIKVARQCAQVIVLSHDPTFLRQVWEKAPAAERVSLMIADHRAQGSKLIPIDLEAACRGRTVTDIDDLQTYLTTGAGALLDVIRKMRVVLETYCRTTYSTSFLGTDWLGDIVRKIREGGAGHPAEALYDELDQINGYTSQYHHGEDFTDLTPDQIDPTELKGFARRTLRLVNALQA